MRHERGSLIGLHSALTHCRDAVVVVGWDMPFLNTALLAELRARGERSSAAAVPEGPFGPEPLCAYYPRSCLAIVEAQIERGELRLSAMIDALPSRVIVARDEVARFGSPARLFANINSATDLADALLLANTAARPGPVTFAWPALLATIIKGRTSPALTRRRASSRRCSTRAGTSGAAISAGTVQCCSA